MHGTYNVKFTFGLFTNVQEIDISSETFGRDLGPNKPSAEFIPRALSPGKKRPGREDKRLPRLMPRLRINGAIQPLHGIPLWHACGYLYLYFDH